MAYTSPYVIRGGIEGRERLRVLGRVMHESSSLLFDRLGLKPGWSCLDVGCGGGDVAFELASRVGPLGRVVGVDIDSVQLAIADAEARQLGLEHVRFEQVDVRYQGGTAEFDLVYARFLLTHLSDPASAVASLHCRVKPGGWVAVEDIDFTGYFTWPRSRALTRYRELYCATVTKRGGDPNIGPRLPSLLLDAGLEDVDVAVTQPVSLRGEAKLINALTMEHIVDSVLEDGLATMDEVKALVQELYDFAANPATVAGLPRVVQAWGRRAQ